MPGATEHLSLRALGAVSGRCHVLLGLLAAVGVRDAKVWRTHDIRRGHERDIKDRGGRLCELRAAAGWSERSTAFTSYLDMDEVEDEAVQEAHDCSSSDESLVSE